MVVSNNGGFPKGKRRSKIEGESVKVTVAIPKELSDQIEQISNETHFAKSKVLHKIIEMADLDIVADALYEEIEEAEWELALSDLTKNLKKLPIEDRLKFIQSLKAPAKK